MKTVGGEHKATVDTDFRASFVGASLTVEFVVRNPELIRLNNKARGAEVDVDAIIRHDAERRVITAEVEGLRAEQNAQAKQGKPDEQQLEMIRARRERIKELEIQQREVTARLKDLMDHLPNLTHPDVPIGNATANAIVKQVGKVPEFAFDPIPHHVLGVELELLDFERGAKVAGNGFYYLKNELLLMRYALVAMFMQRAMSQGFVPMSTPLGANERTLYGTGYFPFAVKDNYRLQGEDLLLIGTSEQALVGQHMDEILPSMPLKYVADTPCFRTEAGSYGRSTQGMIRVHQFGKVEQIIFCEPEDADAMQQLCLENEEWLLQALGIPYQVVLLATGDLGAPGFKKYDIEAWFPSQNRFVELTSNTNLSDFQTRRLGIRFRTNAGTTVHPYTISATGFSDRLLAAILENFQDDKGGVTIPPTLRQYMGGNARIGK